MSRTATVARGHLSTNNYEGLACFVVQDGHAHVKYLPNLQNDEPEEVGDKVLIDDNEWRVLDVGDVDYGRGFRMVHLCLRMIR